MSDVAAPPAPSAPTAPAEGAAAPAPAPEPGAPQNAIEAILAKRQAKEAAAAKEEPADKPGDPPKDGDKPQPPAEEKGLSLRHAQLKADHRKVLADRETFKTERDAAAKERDELKAMFGPGKNHLAALEKAVGKPFKQIMEDAARGAYDQRNALPPEQQAKLDAFDRWKQEQEAEKAQKQAAAARAEDVGVADEFMKANTAKYPLFALSGFAAEDLVERAYAELKEGRQPDFDALARQAEEYAVANLEKFFDRAELLSVLVKRPNVRQSLLQALGLSENNAARPASSTQGGSGAGTGPRTLTHTSTQESPVPPESPPNEEEDWMAGAKARLAQYKQHGRIGR
jgi:hypothetical protein